VVIASRSIEKLEAATKELSKVGSGEVTPIPCNIRKEDDVKYADMTSELFHFSVEMF